MTKEFIVAIELGSSKITGIAGKKNPDGSISILAVVKEDSTSCIRKGVVFNIDKTVLCLTNIVKKLETSLKTNIARVYVGVGGQSIRSVKNIIVKTLPAETIVSQDMINELMDANRSMSYADQEILDAVTQEYKVDSLYQLDPVGIPCLRLEGNFLNILWRKTFYKNLNQCINKAGMEIAELYLAPLALADAVLTETEKRSGCILVDLGADTTTVLVYYKNILRHLAVIPLGGENITKDITSLLMEESQAEDMKLKYASAYTDNKDIDENKKYPIDSDRKVESRKFIEIVESRLQEIIENVFYQVPNEYADKLIGGLLAKGDINCAGDEINTDLFQANDAKHTATTPTQTKEPRSFTETSGTGIVQTEEEKERLRKQKEAQEEAERLAKEEEERRIAEEKRENSPMNKLWKGIKNFARKITEEEE